MINKEDKKDRINYSKLKKSIINMFPDKYTFVSGTTKIKCINSLTELDEIIEDVKLVLAKDFGTIVISNKVGKVFGKNKESNKILQDFPNMNSNYFSGTYESLYFYTDEYIEPIIVTPTNIGTSTKISIELKEILVCYFFETERNFEPLYTGQKISPTKKKENFNNFINDILDDIKSNSYYFIDNKTKIQNELKDFLNKYKLTYLKNFNNLISIGNWLKDSEYNDWKIDRNIYLHKIKKIGARIANLSSPDKWNPMDILLYKDESIINEIISNIEKLDDSEESLQIINNYFITDFENIDDSKILAISLKDQKSQGGKGKSILNTLFKDQKHLFNLTNEEFDLLDEENYVEIFQEKIGDLRLNIKHNIKSNIIYKLNENEFYNYSGGSSKNKFIQKYGALKITNFIIENNNENNDLFIKILKTSMSIGYNPVFYKLVGSDSGETSKVKIEKFNTNESFNIIDPIIIDDLNSNYDIKIRFELEYNDKNLNKTLRISSQHSNPKSQISIELK